MLDSVSEANLTAIDWAIIGGESGPSAREMRDEWVAEIYDACQKSGTAFFFKQWGDVNKKKTGRVWQGKTWDEYPVKLPC